MRNSFVTTYCCYQYEKKQRRKVRMSKRDRKTKCSRLISRLTGKSLRTLLINAGFPYHESPCLYQWLWVFILLPFSEEDSLCGLAERYGGKLRKLHRILTRHSDAFGKLLRMLAMPLFHELLSEFDAAGDTTRSRMRIRIIIDDTKCEKFGKHTELIQKLFDNAKDRYIMGYDYVLMIAVSGDVVLPLSLVLWLPTDHPDHRSKNDIACDEIRLLREQCDRWGQALGETEILFDSAYCVQKVVKAADDAGLRIITKAGNTHKFEFEGGLLTPKEIAEKVRDRQWKYLQKNHLYQRIVALHHTYGDVILTVRRRRLKNGKVISDVLMCNKPFYNAVRIHKSYKKDGKLK